jgi:hypothetical protein
MKGIKMVKKLFLGIIVGVLITTGTAVAVIPDGDGTIHACYNSNGIVHIIDPSLDSCGQNETSLTWNQTGLQGPQGPQGVPGPMGPAGTSIAYLSDYLSVPANANSMLVRFNTPLPDRNYSVLLTPEVGGAASAGYCALVGDRQPYGFVVVVQRCDGVITDPRSTAMNFYFLVIPMTSGVTPEP